MTPRRFDPEVVDEKLRLMEPLLDVLEDLGRLSRQRLETEPLTRLATERILTQLVDLASSANAHIASARLGRVPKEIDLGKVADSGPHALAGLYVRTSVR